MDLRQYGSVEAHVLYDNKLILLCHSSGFNVLLCYDLDDNSLKWKIDISNEKPYHTRELCLFENKITCYGQDRLLFIDIENGDIVDAIQISRIDKLFHPTRLDEENILIGYTNWTNAGIIRYNINSKQVIWRNKRKFQGPQLKCKIYQHRDTVMWVKNDTELICLNMDNGEELYHRRTSPWLYTDLQFINDSILFGTSGSDGFLNCVDAKNGMEK